jgi:predicted hydrolase (HD superfamily)
MAARRSSRRRDTAGADRRGRRARALPRLPRELRLSRTLVAADELSGLVGAKMKQPSFAATLSREAMRLGAGELGLAGSG